MKTHVEIKISFSRIPKGGLHEILRDFAKQTKGWEFPKRQSEEYQCHHGSDAGFAVVSPTGEFKASAVAIANVGVKRPNSFCVPNIVPRDSSTLTLDEYNAIGIAFADSFGGWMKRGLHHGTIEIIGPNRTLADIIPGKKARQLFEAWLQTPTPGSHPSDIHVLDCFICHLFRHRGGVRTYEIEPYLSEDLGWKAETARWVVARIETGLELLRVDRKF